MKTYTLLLLITLAVGLPGCMLAPTYKRPAAPIPQAWPAGDAYEGNHAPPEAPAPATLDWSAFCADDNLRQVITIALANNRDLRLAALNVEQARAFYDIQRSELAPVFEATANGNRSRSAADLHTSNGPRVSEQYDVNLGIASWEIDLFGRIRSLKEAALEEYFATEQARRSAQIALISSVAQAYVALAADRSALSLAETTLTSQDKARELVKERFNQGLVAELDVYRADTQVAAAMGNVARYTQLVAQDKNSLDFLAGTALPDGLLPAGVTDLVPFHDISAGLPSDALLGRPDVLQAENYLKAANANIGAARAALFPRISLTAAIGTASDDLSRLFKPGNDTWNYSPTIAMPIFDSRVWAANRVSKTQRELAVTQYEKTLQTAFREVADALAVCGTIDRQVTAQDALVGAVRKTYDLAQVRYTKGVDSYLSVLDAQRSLFDAQQTLIALRLIKRLGQIRLYAALGGGWQAAPTTDTP